MSSEQLNPYERIILALDFADFNESEKWVKRFSSKIKTYKVGPILYVKNGTDVLKRFSELGADIFLDLKFHDIPSTVEKTVRQLADLNINMFTLHALGGFDMMKRVSESVAEEADKLSKQKPITLAVTVLTSHDESTLSEIGINNSTKDEVLKLAGVADKAGIDGLVCSGQELEFIKQEFGDRFKLVIPGIRPASNVHDQKRVMTPEAAVSKGADYLVIGRAITEAEDPDEVVEQIKKDIS
ncbi:MAG TPA: orotidine-5'-phosphate decarboxylase [Thermodesulfobacteriota bacterium]|nr:orotidine-5'-phosphate decarboxylase [Thermodesulfobacteriota bacterium]